MSEQLVIALLVAWAVGPFITLMVALWWQQRRERLDREADELRPMLAEVERIRALPERRAQVRR